LWENSTTKAPVKVEFGPEYTMKGDIRIQKIYGHNGTVFPYVFLPEAPIEVRQDPSEPFQPELPEAPMRTVVASAGFDKKDVERTLEAAEGNHVEITFNLSVDAERVMEPVKLIVERINILGDAKNSN
jgi:hypothetical protein